MDANGLDLRGFARQHILDLVFMDPNANPSPRFMASKQDYLRIYPFYFGFDLYSLGASNLGEDVGDQHQPGGDTRPGSPADPEGTIRFDQASDIFWLVGGCVGFDLH
jgi:hypothetical protein